MTTNSTRSRKKITIALQAVFAGVDKAERGYDPDPSFDGCGNGSSAKSRRPSRAIPDLAAWIKAELAALPPQAMVFAAASDFPAGRQPRAAGEAAAGASPEARRYSSAWQGGRPGNVELRRMVCRRDSAIAVTPMNRLAARPWLAGSPTPQSTHLAIDRQPGLALAFRPGAGRRPAISAGWEPLPSHPELLDWLAGEFLESGARSRQLHRLIVTSAVYRQSVRHDPSFARDRQ